MHHNDLKCCEIVDNFCYMPKSFCSIKNRIGGGGQCWLVLGLLFRIWPELKSNGHNSSRNGFYDL